MSAVEGASSMARIIELPRSTSVAELQRAIMDWELRVAEHEGRQELVQDSVEVATMKRMMTAEMAERCIEGPNTHAKFRSRVAAVQYGNAPKETGKVQDGDAQLGEARTRRPRRDERSQRDRAQETQGCKRRLSGAHRIMVFIEISCTFITK